LTARVDQLHTEDAARSTARSQRCSHPFNDLIVEILRKIQPDVSDLKKDNREIKESLSRVERQVHSLRGDIQELRGDFL
jgi:CHAD domain-containing protein